MISSNKGKNRRNEDATSSFNESELSCTIDLPPSSYGDPENEFDFEVDLTHSSNSFESTKSSKPNLEKLNNVDLNSNDSFKEILTFNQKHHLNYEEFYRVQETPSSMTLEVREKRNILLTCLILTWLKFFGFALLLVFAACIKEKMERSTRVMQKK